MSNNVNPNDRNFTDHLLLIFEAGSPKAHHDLFQTHLAHINDGHPFHD
ncbi:hypothetical protein [Pseudomonas agarici]|nr:hypothetical protein [Pseudomonas agarici]